MTDTTPTGDVVERGIPDDVADAALLAYWELPLDDGTLGIPRRMKAAIAAADEARGINELVEACKGHEYPPLWRVGWLKTMLDEIDAGTFGRIGEDEDPSATFEMVSEVRDLAKRLYAAFQCGEMPNRHGGPLEDTSAAEQIGALSQATSEEGRIGVARTRLKGAQMSEVDWQATVEIGELRGKIERLREVLTAHHQWHLDAGEMGLFKQDDGEWFVQDMTAEYSDSTLCEKTLEALQGVTSTGKSREGVSPEKRPDPPPAFMTFYDQNYTPRQLEWCHAEPDAGMFGGWVIPNGANWEVKTLPPAPPPNAGEE